MQTRAFMKGRVSHDRLLERRYKGRLQMPVESPAITSSSKATEGNAPSVFITPTKSPKVFEHGLLTESDARRLHQLQIPTDVFDFFRDRYVGHPFDFNIDSGNGFRDNYETSLYPGLLIR